MTTQLWGWKCNGQDEFGYELSNRSHDGSRRFARIDSGTSGFMRDTRFITDLRPAKVVDADAVVIEKDVIHFDKFLNEVIEVSGSNYDFNYTKSQKVHECAMYLQYKIYPTPPVTEPTGFGAIVEAEAKHYEGERTRFVRATLGSQPNWFCDTIRQKVGDREQVIRYYWSDLTNPAVISEGVRN